MPTKYIYPMRTLSVGSFSTKCSLMVATVAVCVAVVPAVASAAKVKQIMIRGNVSQYQIPTPGMKTKGLAGASVWVAERPSLRTTTNQTGAFTLKIPAGVKATLVAQLAGYVRIYTPTRIPSSSYRWSYILLPKLDLGRAISALTGMALNAAKTAPKECLVSALVADKVIRTMTPAQVDARGPYGVPGTTLRSSGPMTVKPLYFAGSGLPDATLTSTSNSGIGFFIGLKAGTYKFSSVKAGFRFESFTATCQPGRFIMGVVGEL